MRVPIKGKSVFSFGKTMHSVLFQFLKSVGETIQAEQGALFEFEEKAVQLGKKVSPELKDLINLYEKSWIDEWYESKNQKEEYYKLGKKIIKDFYEEFSKKQPKVLRINEDLALEIPFSLKIEGYGLRGVIDRIDEIKDGVEIIDYKTGHPKEKLDLDDKEQLLIYQIAAEEVFKIKPKKLTYYYLENGSQVSFLGTEKEKTQQKEKIIQEIQEMKRSNFKATPGWQCAFCDFKDICDFAQR